MEIDFWGGTTCTAARYDESAREWTVTVTREGEARMLRPKQLVLATGLSGAKHVPVIPGAERFTGWQYHSADHGSGAGLAGKRCVVIGSNNSAHDICVDLWEHDADVTMVQRSATIVVRADTMREVSKSIYYAQPGADIDLADLMFAANPFRPRTTFEKGFTDYLRDIDAAFYARLEKSGFHLWHGEDETGFFMAYYRRAGGYYIDVGGSELIASGEVKVQRGEIAEILEEGVRMADGTVLPADVIVYATGYRSMSEWVGQLISPDVERKVGRCWGLGSGTQGDPGPWAGELRNMWKPTAQPALWFQGGNLMQCRFHSLHVALQLKARMEGLSTPVYGAPQA
jgi:putative flavoprotein involved in K+ transport